MHECRAGAPSSGVPSRKALFSAFYLYTHTQLIKIRRAPEYAFFSSIQVNVLYNLYIIPFKKHAPYTMSPQQKKIELVFIRHGCVDFRRVVAVECVSLRVFMH